MTETANSISFNLSNPAYCEFGDKRQKQNEQRNKNKPKRQGNKVLLRFSILSPHCNSAMTELLIHSFKLKVSLM